VSEEKGEEAVFSIPQFLARRETKLEDRNTNEPSWRA